MTAFSTGFNTGQGFFNSLNQRRMGERKLDMTEQGMEFQQRQKAFDDTRKQFGDAAKQAALLLEKGGPQTRQQAMESLNLLKEQAAERESLMKLQPGTLTTIIDMAGMTPSVTETAQVAGEAQGVAQVAQAGQVADAAGVGVREALGFKDQQPTDKQRLLEGLKAAGADEMTSLAAANGLIDVRMDNDTGEVIITNKVDGSVQRVGARAGIEDEETGEGATGAPGPDRETVMGALPQAAGVQNVIADALPKIPLLGSLFLNEDVTRARSRFKLFNEGVVTGIIKNPRFPVAEQNRVQRLLPSEGIFENEERAAVAYDELRKYLHERNEEDRRSIRGGKLTKSQTGTLIQRVEARDTLISQLGTIDDFKLSKIPQPAIEHLKANPNLRERFDEHYGKGMAARVLGDSE